MPRFIPALMALGAIGLSFAPAPALATTVNDTVTAQVGSTSVSLTVNAGIGAVPMAPCKADTCEGLDPYKTGCASLTTVRPLFQVPNINANGVLVSITELMFSGSCASYWGEVIAVQPPTGPAPFPIIHAYLTPTDLVPDHSYTGLAINVGNSWTPMISGNLDPQACTGVTPGGFGFACTSVV